MTSSNASSSADADGLGAAEVVNVMRSLQSISQRRVARGEAQEVLDLWEGLNDNIGRLVEYLIMEESQGPAAVLPKNREKKHKPVVLQTWQKHDELLLPANVWRDNFLILKELGRGAFLDDIQKSQRFLPITRKLVDLVRSGASQEALSQHITHCLELDGENMIFEAWLKELCDDLPGFVFCELNIPRRIAELEQLIDGLPVEASANRRKPGRRQEFDPEADRKLCEDWKASEMEQGEFEAKRGLDKDAVRRAQDRLKSRRRRASARRPSTGTS